MRAFIRTMHPPLIKNKCPVQREYTSTIYARVCLFVFLKNPTKQPVGLMPYSTTGVIGWPMFEKWCSDPFLCKEWEKYTYFLL